MQYLQRHITDLSSGPSLITEQLLVADLRSVSIVSFQLQLLTDNWSSEVFLMGGECKQALITTQRKLSDSNTHKMNTRLLCVFHFIFLSVYEIQSKSHPKPSCGYPPSQWCRSLQIAIECGVSLLKRLI